MAMRHDESREGTPASTQHTEAKRKKQLYLPTRTCRCPQQPAKRQLRLAAHYNQANPTK